MRRLSLAVLYVMFCLSFASAQQFPAPDPRLTACQEQLAASRGAVNKIPLPNVAFQAENLVTLDTKLSEAMQRQAQDAATINALRKELGALGQPSPETPTSSPAPPASP